MGRGSRPSPGPRNGRRAEPLFSTAQEQAQAPASRELDIPIGATDTATAIACRGASVTGSHTLAPFSQAPFRSDPPGPARGTVPLQLPFASPCKRRDEDFAPLAALTWDRGLMSM